MGRMPVLDWSGPVNRSVRRRTATGHFSEELLSAGEQILPRRPYVHVDAIQELVHELKKKTIL